MAVLMVQVQPELLASFSEHAVEQLQLLSLEVGLISNAEVELGNDNGRYINISFETPNPKKLWPVVREQLVALGLQRACIVACTGSRGWDDYLLLHHFNNSEAVDKDRRSD